MGQERGYGCGWGQQRECRVAKAERGALCRGCTCLQGARAGRACCMVQGRLYCSSACATRVVGRQLASGVQHIRD